MLRRREESLCGDARDGNSGAAERSMLNLRPTSEQTSNHETKKPYNTPHNISHHIASHRWRYIPVGFYIELILQKDHLHDTRR